MTTSRNGLPTRYTSSPSRDDSSSLPPELKYGYPDDPQLLIAHLTRKDEEARRARRSLDAIAKMNVAFYQGHQWLIRDKSDSSILHRADRDITDDDAPIWLTVNKIGDFVDRAIAKITKQSPIPEGRPVSDDEQDVGAARMTTRILAAEAERIDWQTLLARLYVWVVPAGCSFLQITWDEEKGNGGEVGVEVVPWSELTWDYAAANFNDARWVCRTIGIPVEEVWERYEIDPKDPVAIKSIPDDLDALVAGRSSLSPGQEKVAVHQFWLRKGASRSKPEGCTVTWCGKTILSPPEDFPYDYDGRSMLPFVQFNYLSPQGPPWGRTPVTDMIDEQIDYNHARSTEADIRQRLMPMLVHEAGSIDPDMLIGRAQSIPFTNSAFPPRYETPQSGWVAMWQNAMDRSEREMGSRIGVNDAARGELAGTSPGVTLLSQMEASIEPLAVPAKEQAAAISRAGLQHILLVKQYWPDDRLIRTWSESTGTRQVMRFRKSDLAGELDVRVQTESALPRSKAGRAQLALTLHEAYPDQFDLRWLIRMLELPQSDVLQEIVNVDHAQAERENDRMVEYGMQIDPNADEIQVQMAVLQAMPPVEPWHNHAAHHAAHTEYMKTEEWERMPDRVKALFIAHDQVHQMAVAQQQMAALGLGGSQPAPGGIGGPGVDGIGGDSPMPGATSPLDAAAGTAPPPDVPPTTQLAGIQSGPGTPGRVPGVGADAQAAAMGS